MANYASVGSRIAAIIIDSIIILIVSGIIAIPLGISAALTSPGFTPDFGFIGTFSALNFVLWILYFTYFEAKSGQTGTRVGVSSQLLLETALNDTGLLSISKKSQGGPRDDVKEAKEKYTTYTRQDLLEVLGKYVTDERRIQVIALPKETDQPDAEPSTNGG